MEDLDLSDRLVLKEEQVFNTYGTDYVDDEMCGPGKVFNIKEYCKGIEVEVKRVTNNGYELEFDLINVEPPIANALRRILLAEVPTMAIDKVYMYQNTSVIPDEMLCHRLGLIPIKGFSITFVTVDPRIFEDQKPPLPETEQTGTQERDPLPTEPDPNPMEALVFELKVRCTKNPHASKDSTEPGDLYINSEVYSKQLKWVPIGKQEDIFARAPPAPVHPDILIAKLRPGQEVEARCHCFRGIGRDHAKFSPVATASYRLLPEIHLKEEVRGERAERLQESFSKGVIKLEEDPNTGEKVAKVGNARNDNVSRNVLRHPDLADAVTLTRKKRHFIFSVESVGALKSEELVVEACNAMQRKVKNIQRILDEALGTQDLEIV